MNKKETSQAATALLRWFQSQEIGARDATGIMVVLISSILGTSLDDQAAINKLVDEISPIMKRMAKNYQQIITPE